jgi:hypothetical protein
MGKALIVGGLSDFIGSAPQAPSNTNNATIVSNMNNVWNANENIRQWPMVAGNFVSIGWRSNNVGASRSLVLRNDTNQDGTGADTALEAAATDATAGDWYDAGTVAVSNNDWFSLEIRETGTNPGVYITALVFEATTNHATLMAGMMSGIVNSNAVSRYCSPGGNNTSSLAAVADAQHQSKVAGTIKYAFFCVHSNARTTTTTIKVNINGTTGSNISFNVGAGATGLFVDTSNTETVAVDDLLALELQMGASAENLASFGFGWIFETSSGAASDNMITGGTTTQKTGGVATGYLSLNNGGSTGGGITNTDETICKIKPKFACTASLLRLNCTSFTLSGGTPKATMKLRVNGADVNTYIDIVGTGWVDSGGLSDSIGADDDISFSISDDATSGAMNFKCAAITLEDASVAGGGAKATPSLHAIESGFAAGNAAASGLHPIKTGINAYKEAA